MKNFEQEINLQKTLKQVRTKKYCSNLLIIKIFIFFKRMNQKILPKNILKKEIFFI
jgi:hypothetical protein